MMARVERRPRILEAMICTAALIVAPLVAILCFYGASVSAVNAEINHDLEMVDTLISVGDYSLYFRVIPGSGPTILLEAGGGMDSSEWENLSPEIARKTGATVVSYDRAGFGQSDLPATPYSLLEELEGLWHGLSKLELNENLILVGHSYGGWLIRLFASEHPEAVSGMVFIDPFTTELVDMLGVEYLDEHPMAGKLPFDTSEPEKLTKYQRALVRFVGHGLGPKAEIMRKTNVPVGIPVILLTCGEPFLPKPEEQEAWRKSHEKVVASIDGAVLIVAEKSDHMIPFHQPEIIVDAITSVVRQIN
jgi:pimeloyl-ACP methyl ester carboxylesterase